ncbi:MAG: glucodextranase DOMON-like domain-containing protein [Chitinophagales bacterium]
MRWSARRVTIGAVAGLALVSGLLALWYQFVRLPARAPTPRSVPVISGPAGAEERLLFALSDPAGDDRGPGTYQYPRDAMFVPGLFDLRRFTVTYDARSIHFRLTFGALTNPWGAPEGFYHQRVDLYLDTEPGAGRTAPLRPGANVRFPARHAWDYLVRCAPWKGSRVEPGAAAVAVAVEDGKTLHLTVPRTALPARPSRRWRYYVLVGGYDAFGPDEYRPVTSSGGRWVFGGGQDSNLDPNVLDVLAPRFGRHSQSRQLAVAAGSPAMLYPVGGR